MTLETIKTDEQFSEIVKNNKFVVVDFFSTECPPCEKFAPIYERYALLYPEIKFIKAFRQEHRDLAASLNINSSPSIIFYINGELVNDRLSGDISEESFSEILLKNAFVQTLKETKVNEKSEIKDLCIIGAGPAGLSAAVYAARYMINQVVVGEMEGGLMTSSHKICNYPSENEISGFELTKKMVDHVRQLEVPQIISAVNKIKKMDGSFEISLANGDIVIARKVLLATGTVHKHLGLEGEERLAGHGISYCATCDAMFYRNKTVAVVGGSDSANTAALYLAQVADKVYQIYRGEALRGETAWIEQIKHNAKIEVLYNTQIKKVIGEQKLEAIEIDREYKDSTLLKVDGLFVETGSVPDMTLIEQLEIAVNERGYIITSPGQETSIENVWAAGDITTNSDSFRQIITACSEGAIAARNIFTSLQK